MGDGLQRKRNPMKKQKRPFSGGLYIRFLTQTGIRTGALYGRRFAKKKESHEKADFYLQSAGKYAMIKKVSLRVSEVRYDSV